jgi:hypothetical protein
MTVSMISGRIGCELAVVAAFCVLTIFLFPGMQGPYSVVHGPVTALLAVRAAAKVRIGILQGALRSLANHLILAIVVFSRMSLIELISQTAALLESGTILRC